MSQPYSLFLSHQIPYFFFTTFLILSIPYSLFLPNNIPYFFLTTFLIKYYCFLISSSPHFLSSTNFFLTSFLINYSFLRHNIPYTSNLLISSSPCSSFLLYYIPHSAWFIISSSPHSTIFLSTFSSFFLPRFLNPQSLLFLTSFFIFEWIWMQLSVGKLKFRSREEEIRLQNPSRGSKISDFMQRKLRFWHHAEEIKILTLCRGN